LKHVLGEENSAELVSRPTQAWGLKQRVAREFFRDLAVAVSRPAGAYGLKHETG